MVSRISRAIVIGLSAALLVALVLVIGGPLHDNKAEAAIDMTGEWNILLDAGATDTCSFDFVQTGGLLTANGSCLIFGAGPFTGTITKATGAFSISGTLGGLAVSASGTTDNSTMSGSYTTPFVSGTFTGSIKPPPPKPEISLSANGSGVTCDSQASFNKGDVPKPAKCDVPLGGTFTVSIEINVAPASGYDAWGTEINYGALAYKKAASIDDEIVPLCPGPAGSFRDQAPSVVAHVCDFGEGNKTHDLGNIVELEFSCPDPKSSNVIELLDVGQFNFSTFFIQISPGAVVIPNVDSLGINCVNPRDGQININVVNADNQLQKLADSCWLISVIHTAGEPPQLVNKPYAVLADNNAKPSCDVSIKGTLVDKDPAVGRIAITIPAAAIETCNSTEWHFQQVQTAASYNLDPTKYVCTLSGLNKKDPPNDDLIACDEADPFIIKNVAKSPFKDDFLFPTVVGGLPYSDAVVTKAATLEPNDPPISCKSSYGHSVWYQYTPTANELVTVDTFGSDYDTVLAVFSGPKADLAGNEIACNDDFNSVQSRVVVNLAAGTTYHFLVGSWLDLGGGKLVFNMEAKPKQPKPGDADGDGCPDVHENRDKADASQGGGRDWLDPNDYYDVYGPGQSLVHDGVIDLANDILGVIQHFAPLGTEAIYDVRFDRGQTLPGQNHWKRAAPDGVIDLANDILGVILQFQHNCR